MRTDYHKMTKKELRGHLRTKDYMIKVLEESEASFAKEKVKYEMLYKTTKEQMDYQTRYFIVKEAEYKEKNGEMKSDIRLFKVGIDRMMEDVEKLYNDFKSYKDLMNSNIKKYD